MDELMLPRARQRGGCHAWLERHFRMAARGSSLRTEIVAGLVDFLGTHSDTHHAHRERTTHLFEPSAHCVILSLLCHHSSHVARRSLFASVPDVLVALWLSLYPNCVHLHTLPCSRLTYPPHRHHIMQPMRTSSCWYPRCCTTGARRSQRRSSCLVSPSLPQGPPS